MHNLRLLLVVAALLVPTLLSSGCADDCRAYCNDAADLLDGCLHEYELTWGDIGEGYSNQRDFANQCRDGIEEQIAAASSPAQFDACAEQLHNLFVAWQNQPVLAPELLKVVAWAEAQRFLIAPALLALHLLGGTLLLLGLLCRTTAMAIAITYGLYAAIDFSPAPVLLAVVGLAIALSDAHHQLSLARPNHQSTETG